MSSILIIVGTNRSHSLSSQVAAYYQSLLERRGVIPNLLTLADLPPTFISTALYEKAGKDPAFNQLITTTQQATKYVYIVSAYNGSFPGILKTFIDALPFPATFAGKKCALVGVSKGPRGCLLGINHLANIFQYLRMHVHPLQLSFPNIVDGRIETLLNNPQYVKKIDDQVTAIIDF